MSAFKSNSRGTYVLKRKYPAVPPIRRASGTSDPVMLERLERMCDTLYERGRHDLLGSIADGRLKPLQVYARYRTDELERLPAAELLPALLTTFKAWAESAEGGSETRRARLKAHKRWATIPGAERMSVGELAILLKQDREGRRIAAKAKSFNPRPTLARRTSGRGSGLWPTPTVQEAISNHGYQSSRGRDYPTLTGAVGAAPARGGKMWPTPTARDWRSDQGLKSDAEQYGTKGKPLPRAVGGRLNPTWVEWLMGYPLGWTDLRDSATPSSPSAPSSSSPPSRRGKR